METKEEQYKMLYEVEKKHGRSIFGIMANESWNCDPRRTLFTLSRYKFVSKMIAGSQEVLEIGCADAFGTRLVQQSVKNVTAIDFDPLFIEDVKSRDNKNWPLNTFVHNILDGPVPGLYDSIYSLDVLEHINKKDEDIFLKNLVSSLSKEGVAIIGMPTLESQVWASPQSKAGHVNCKSGDELKETLSKFFKNVFIFSMNDEVIHTGYFPMAHYILALCCSKK